MVTSFIYTKIIKFKVEISLSLSQISSEEKLNYFALGFIKDFSRKMTNFLVPLNQIFSI